MKLKYLFIPLCCVMSCALSDKVLASSAVAMKFEIQEEITVTGLVVDSQGKPLGEASVIIVGTTSGGAKTDVLGRFSLSVKPGSKLRATYVGYNTAEITVTGAGPYRIELTEESQNMEEVVIVGYGTQAKNEFTGSAARVGGDNIKDNPVQSFDQALSGQAAGVNISGQTGLLNNAPVIRIRGTNSISLSSYPLIVIDGVPVTSGDVSSNTIVTNNPLADINPNDIESIDILKDAASTAIYGSRAAGGVLLVTTKRGKEGRSRITYDGWAGASEAVRLPRVLNAEEFMEIKNEAVLNSKLLSGNTNAADALFFPMYDENGNLYDTNWYDEIYQTGKSHSHSVGISGGTQKTSYFFSANYSNQTGIIKTNEFSRSGLRFNVDHEVNKWIRFKGSGSYTNSHNQSPNSGSTPGQAQSINGLARLSQIIYPNVPARNPDGTPYINTDSPAGTIGNGNNLANSVLGNPVALFDLTRYTSENDRILANVGATLKVIEGLDFTTNYAIDRLNVLNINSISPIQGSSSTVNGSVTNVHMLVKNWNFTNTLNYAKKFGANSITALLGMDVQETTRSRWGANRTQASDPFFTDYQGSWGSIAPASTSLSSTAFISYFGRLSYSLLDRYHFTFNYRKDGNSALGRDKKWGDFGGVSAGWHISQEDFFRDSRLGEFMNNLRFRASWGRVGNGNLNNAYSSLALFSSSLYGGAATFEMDQAGNPNLGWETSDQTNIGLDFGFLRNRFQGEITYFHNDVNGLILSVPQTPSKGIPGNSILSNVGSLYNKGLEFAISGNVIDNSNFKWNASFNITAMKNEVTALSGDGERILGTTSQASNVFNVTQVGLSVGTLFGALTDGVNPENGRRIFINKEGERVQYSHTVPSGQSRWTYMDGSPADPITADDYQPLGNALPKWYGGFNNTFTYKNFDLSLNITFSGGNYMLNGNMGTWIDQRWFNNTEKVLERWQKPGDITSVPRLVYNDPMAAANIANISEFVEKADFARIQLVGLGYRLPNTVFGNSGLSSMRLYFQVNNAYLFTNYSGLEPESSVNGNSNTSPGIELNSMGGARTYTFGLNIAL